MPASHNGYCQVCGREQAHSHLGIAKHGYEVAGYGYFHGVCPGAGHEALEHSREYADIVAAQLRRQAADSRHHAEWLRDGVEVPLQAKSGKRVRSANGILWDDEFVPFDQAPEQYRQEAVRSLIARHLRDAEIALQVADEIVARADKITGKVALRERAPASAKRVLQVGDRVRVYGSEGVVVEIRSQVCRGVGPYLNGNVLPHAIVERADGGKSAIPVRLIKQKNIL